MDHPYLQFRLRMARHGLRQFLASLTNSLEIVLLGFGPLLIGLAAGIALPGMLAVNLPWPAMLAILAGQAVFTALPAVLLRQRLHPADAVAWARPLPLPPALGWQADALTAALLAGPLALLYAVSAAIWLYQWPDWLRPVAPQAIAATALSLLLGWALATLALVRRRLGLGLGLGPRPAARAAAGVAEAGLAPSAAPCAACYFPRPLLPLLPALWHRLFWLPFWRTENRVGVQQCLLLLGALAATAAWLLRLLPLPGAAMGGMASAMLILLTDRGDKAVREQTAQLKPVLALWPLHPTPLLLCARLFTLLPAAAVLAAFPVLLGMACGGAAHDNGHRAELAWLACAATACCAIAGLTLGPRGRVVLVVLSILILTAIGSEF